MLLVITRATPPGQPEEFQASIPAVGSCSSTHKQTLPLEYMLGLNLVRPPFVVRAVTVGDLRG